MAVRMRSGKTRIGRRGLSVVELLVVIGALGLLVGLLVPALSGVRAAGRSTKCLNNLRQMTTAAEMYAMLNADWYPTALRYDIIDNVAHTISWDWHTTSEDEIKPGAIWSHVDHAGEVLQCPEYHGPTNSHEDEPFTGYNYNTTHIGGEPTGPFAVGWENVRRGVRTHQCRRGSECAMFGDGGWSGGANKYMRSPLDENLSLDMVYAGAQAFRHGGSTNVAYVDGHVGSVSRAWEGRDSTPAVLDIMDYPDNGFLSDDDSAYDPR